MTRAQRIITISAISATLYFLALFAIVPLPLLAQETAEKVLPVVCLTSRRLSPITPNIFTDSFNSILVALVVACLVRRVCHVDSWLERHDHPGLP